MNEYEEAFSNIILSLPFDGVNLLKEVRIFKKLVERATPKKPKEHTCCFVYYNKGWNYCPHCGQALGVINNE